MNGQKTSISKNESGRTMLELFTVLVISGLLIMAFIHGYKWATDLHRSNEILHEMENRAFTLATFYGRTGWPVSEDPAKGVKAELGEFDNERIQGYKIDMTTMNDGMFVFAVRDLPISVCTKILKDWSLVEWIMVGADNADSSIGDGLIRNDHYYNFEDPNPELCRTYRKKKVVDGEQVELDAVDMFFWFHKDLNMCEGPECGNELG